MSNQTMYPSVNVYFKRFKPGHSKAGQVFISAFYFKGDAEWLAYAKQSVGVTWTKGAQYTEPRANALREVIRVNGLVRVPPSDKHVYYMYIRPEDQCSECGELIGVFCGCAPEVTEADVTAYFSPDKPNEGTEAIVALYAEGNLDRAELDVILAGKTDEVKAEVLEQVNALDEVPF